LPQTKSDSHIGDWNNTGKSKKEHLDALGLRKDSPPRLLAEAPAAIAQAETSSGSGSASGSVSPSPDARALRRKSTKNKHIKFNTFVEQCIAIDKPTASTPASNNSSLTNVATAANPTRPGQGKWDGRTSGQRWAGNIDDEDDEDEGHRYVLLAVISLHY
jgi:hypothetical protein